MGHKILHSERGAVFVEYSILTLTAVFMAFALQVAFVGHYSTLDEFNSGDDQAVEQTWENGFLIEAFSGAGTAINTAGGGTTGDPPDNE